MNGYFSRALRVFWRLTVLTFKCKNLTKYSGAALVLADWLCACIETEIRQILNWQSHLKEKSSIKSTLSSH